MGNRVIGSTNVESSWPYHRLTARCKDLLPESYNICHKRRRLRKLSINKTLQGWETALYTWHMFYTQGHGHIMHGRCDHGGHNCMACFQFIRHSHICIAVRFMQLHSHISNISCNFVQALPRWTASSQTASNHLWELLCHDLHLDEVKEGHHHLLRGRGGRHRPAGFGDWGLVGFLEQWALCSGARGVQRGVAAGQPRWHSEGDCGGGRGQPEGQLEVIIGVSVSVYDPILGFGESRNRGIDPATSPWSWHCWGPSHINLDQVGGCSTQRALLQATIVSISPS